MRLKSLNSPQTLYPKFWSGLFEENSVKFRIDEFFLDIVPRIDGELGEPLISHVVAERGERVGGRHRLQIAPHVGNLTGDYELIAVARSSAPELDETNNQVKLAPGVFRTPDGSVHVHGSRLMDSVDVSASSTVDVRLNPRFMVDTDNNGSVTQVEVNNIARFLQTRDQTPWRNPDNPLDVDDDGIATPTDTVVLINRINTTGPIENLPPPIQNGFSPPPYYDVNGDGSLNSIDVFKLISHLNRGDSDWFNRDNPWDVNGDWLIDANDVELVSRFVDRPLPGADLEFALPTSWTLNGLPDVDADNRLSKLDADLVRAYLRQPSHQNHQDVFDVNQDGDFSHEDISSLHEHLQAVEEYHVHNSPAPSLSTLAYDVDGNDFISQVDLDRLQHQSLLMSGLITAPYHNAENPFDVNEDGIVDIEDAIAIEVALGATIHRFEKTEVARVRIAGHDGADTLTTSQGSGHSPYLDVSVMAWGGGGDDTLMGSPRHDVIDGGDGNDLILGHLGDDWLSGGTGNDTLFGGDGDDVLVGGDEEDNLLGGAGANQIMSQIGDLSIDGSLEQFMFQVNSPWLVTLGVTSNTLAIDLARSIDLQSALDALGISSADPWTDVSVVASSDSTDIEFSLPSDDTVWVEALASGSASITIQVNHPDAVTSNNPMGTLETVVLQVDFLAHPIAWIVNGGFEEPELDHNGWDAFNDEQVPGWTILDGPTDPGPLLEIHRGLFGGPAEGFQYAELDGDQNGPDGLPLIHVPETGSVTIAQTLDTVAGQSYVLSYDFAARPGTDEANNELHVAVYDFAGATPQLISERHHTASGIGHPTIRWRTESISFVAQSNTTQITFADLGHDNTVGTFLDNVWINRPLVDIDIDSNNDGQITSDEDPLEDERTSYSPYR